MANVTFFALANCVDFNHVGGLESLLRRLAIALAEMGDTVDYVHYDAQTTEERPVNEWISQKYFGSLKEAFEENSLQIVECFSDVAGTPLKDASRGITVVAMKST